MYIATWNSWTKNYPHAIPTFLFYFRPPQIVTFSSTSDTHPILSSCFGLSFAEDNIMSCHVACQTPLCPQCCLWQKTNQNRKIKLDVYTKFAVPVGTTTLANQEEN